MANPETFKTAQSATTQYDFDFEYIKANDVKVKLNNVDQTQPSNYTVVTGQKKIEFTSQPTAGHQIHIYRDTDVETASSTFAAGSSIKATDLNNNQKQVLHAIQELTNISTTSTGLALATGDKVDIRVNSAGSWEIIDGQVDNACLSSTAVNNNKIVDNTISETKLAIHNAPSVNKVLGYTSNGLEWTEPVTFLKPSCLLRHPPDTALAHVSDSNTSNGVPITHQHVEHNVGIAGQVCVVSNSNSRIQVKVAGTYLVSALTAGTVQNTPDPSDAIGFVLKKNGSIYTDEQTFPQMNFGATTGEEYSLSFCIPIVLAVDDYLEVAYMNIAGSSANCVKGYFSVSKI